MTCPDPAPGTLGPFSGTLGGALWQPVDVFSRKDGINYNWQYPAVLTDRGAGPGHGGACERYRNNQRVGGERWLVLALTAGDLLWSDAPYPPATPEAPFRLEHNVVVYHPDGGSVGYKLVVTRVLHSQRCHAAEANPSSGYVDFTQIDDAGLAGYVALDFGGEHIEGDFTAPACALCVPRPTKLACLD